MYVCMVQAPTHSCRHTEAPRMHRCRHVHTCITLRPVIYFSWMMTCSHWGSSTACWSAVVNEIACEHTDAMFHIFNWQTPSSLDPRLSFEESRLDVSRCVKERRHPGYPPTMSYRHVFFRLVWVFLSLGHAQNRRRFIQGVAYAAM